MTTADRFKDSLTAIVQEITARTKFHGSYEYLIDTCSNGVFSGSPTDEGFGLPPLKEIPVKTSVVGGIATWAAGATVIVTFINGDASRPLVTAFQSGANPTTVQERAGASWKIDAASIVLNGGTQGVARLGDTVQAGPYSGTITSASSTVKAG